MCRISVVQELGLCMNYLRKGHIAEKCQNTTDVQEKHKAPPYMYSVGSA